jgi:hypothetical protein
MGSHESGHETLVVRSGFALQWYTTFVSSLTVRGSVHSRMFVGMLHVVAVWLLLSLL